LFRSPTEQVPFFLDEERNQRNQPLVKKLLKINLFRYKKITHNAEALFKQIFLFNAPFIDFLNAFFQGGNLQITRNKKPKIVSSSIPLTYQLLNWLNNYTITRFNNRAYGLD